MTFNQLDKNQINMNACLDEFSDKDILSDQYQRTHILSMKRNLMRNFELLKTSFQAHSNSYSNFHNCVAIDSKQLNFELETISPDLYKSNVFNHFLTPTSDNKLLLIELQSLYLRIKTLRETVFEHDFGNSSKSELYERFKAVVVELLHISDTILNEIHQTNDELSLRIRTIIFSYAILPTKQITYDVIWKTVKQISKFACREHKNGKIFNIQIPTLSNDQLILSTIYSIPVITHDKTIEIIFHPSYIIGEINNPSHIIPIDEINKHCYKQNATFLCKLPSQKAIDSNMCIFHFLTTSQISDTCDIFISNQSHCISKFVGSENTTLVQVCQSAQRSWIGSFNYKSPFWKISQLTISNEQVNYFSDQTIEIQQYESRKTYQYLTLGAIMIVCVFYIVAWIGVWCETITEQI